MCQLFIDGYKKLFLCHDFREVGLMRTTIHADPGWRGRLRCKMHDPKMGQDPNSVKHCCGRPGPICLFGRIETRTAHADAHALMHTRVRASRFVPSTIAGPEVKIIMIKIHGFESNGGNHCIKSITSSFIQKFRGPAEDHFNHRDSWVLSHLLPAVCMGVTMSWGRALFFLGSFPLKWWVLFRLSFWFSGL